MKRSKQQLRTGEIVPVAGTWLSECARPGCLAVVEMNLERHQGAPAPPCPRCLNHTSLRFLRPVARPEPPAEAPTEIAAPAEPMAAELPMPYFDSVRSTPKEETPAEVDPIVEMTATAEVKPSLFEKLTGKSRGKKVGK